MDNHPPCSSVAAQPAGKRRWSAPTVSTIKVQQTELGSGYYGEMVGLNGCTLYDASAATNVCVAST